jgi:hypothetical protein
VQELASGGRSPGKLAVCFFVSLLHTPTSVAVSSSSTPANNIVKMLEGFILLSSALLGDIGRNMISVELCFLLLS